MNHEEREAQNTKHSENPEVGDYWHEMFCPICVVIETGRHHVVLCQKTKATDADHWTWDLDELTVKTRAQFTKMLRYDSEKMKHKTIGYVVPGGHKWAAELAANANG